MAEKDLKTGILDLLRNNPEHVSGEAMSAELGVSRAYVWKHITEMKDEGYNFEAVPNLGYKLLSVPDKFFEREIKTGLSTVALGNKTVHYFDSVVSTNDVAYEYAEHGAPEGDIVIAETQTGGKGRLGRKWISPCGVGIYFSVVLRPSLALESIPTIPLVAALSVVEAIQSETGITAGIKWPNDVFCGGGKVCGILTEMKAQQDKVDFIILGIGINVNTDKPDLPEGGTSLKLETGKPALERVRLLRTILCMLERDYGIFVSGGFAALREKCKKYSIVLGKNVKIASPKGEINGTVLDIDENGRLVLDDSGTERRIFSGDIEMCR